MERDEEHYEQRCEKRGDMSVMQIYKMTSTGGAKRKE